MSENFDFAGFVLRMTNEELDKIITMAENEKMFRFNRDFPDECTCTVNDSGSDTKCRQRCKGPLCDFCKKGHK